MTIATVTNSDPKPLSKREESALRAREEIIAKGAKAYIATGTALEDIRAGELFRATHKTFEAYASDRWELSAARARQLIAAAKTAVEISTAGDEPPANEGQAKALGGLSAEDKVATLRKAREAAKDGRLTAADITAARPDAADRAKAAEDKTSADAEESVEAAEEESARAPMAIVDIPQRSHEEYEAIALDELLAEQEWLQARLAEVKTAIAAKRKTVKAA